MKAPEVAAYYFPQWHPDPRNDRWHGKGWTEWELLKTSVPRYAGHRQPVEPAWGYFDESDPALPMFTVNAWNKWTEGAYLLPDNRDGIARLEIPSKVMKS